MITTGMVPVIIPKSATSIPENPKIQPGVVFCFSSVIRTFLLFYIWCRITAWGDDKFILSVKRNPNNFLNIFTHVFLA